LPASKFRGRAARVAERWRTGPRAQGSRAPAPRDPAGQLRARVRPDRTRTRPRRGPPARVHAAGAGRRRRRSLRDPRGRAPRPVRRADAGRAALWMRHTAVVTDGGDSAPSAA